MTFLQKVSKQRTEKTTKEAQEKRNDRLDWVMRSFVVVGGVMVYIALFIALSMYFSK